LNFPSIGLTTVLCCLLPLAGCDDTVIDPFENDGRIYSVWGYVSLFETQHAVRVVPITRYPERIRHPGDVQAEIDATVTSIDLTTGYELRWAHALRELGDGSYGHVFTASFDVHPGRRYRLVVTRSDGATATAETRVPYSVSTTRIDLDPSVSLDEFAAGRRPPPLKARLHDQFVPTEIAVVYSVHSINVASGIRARRVHDVVIDYGRIGYQDGRGNLEFSVDLYGDGSELRSGISALQSQDLLGGEDLYVRDMTVRAVVQDSAWATPDGGFDRNVLSIPGALSNVENGYGYFGSVGLLQRKVELGPEYNGIFGLIPLDPEKGPTDVNP
jgi:hypothetical protein